MISRKLIRRTLKRNAPDKRKPKNGGTGQADAPRLNPTFSGVAERHSTMNDVSYETQANSDLSR